MSAADGASRSNKRVRTNAEETNDLVDRMSRKQDCLPRLVVDIIKSFAGENDQGTVAELHILQEKVLLQEWRDFFAKIIKPAAVRGETSVVVFEYIVDDIHWNREFGHPFLQRSCATVEVIARRHGFTAQWGCEGEDAHWHFYWWKDAYAKPTGRSTTTTLSMLAKRVKKADDLRFEQYVDDFLTPAADKGCESLQSSTKDLLAYFNIPDVSTTNALQRVLEAAKRYGVSHYELRSFSVDCVRFIW